MDAILAVLEKAGRYLLTIRITDLLDIAIMAYLVYKLLSLVKSTRAANILKGVAIFLAALWLSSVLELRSVNYLLSHMVSVGVLALMILFQPEAASKSDRSSIPYAIDRGKSDLTLQEITRSAINFLSKDLSKGFFLMVEGGKIDWACHSNDAATTFHEVIDFDNAIKVAYEFYSQHPDETLIVVTADHETGGFVLGKGPYELNLQVFKNQKVSESGFTKVINQLRSKTNNQVSWEAVQQALKDNFGFWDKIKLNEKQEARLKTVYEQTLKNQQVKMEKSEYAQDEPIAAEAKRIINEIALTGWTSGGHSAGYVPVFAIGAGAEKFQNRIDNTEIPVKIAEAAGYTRK